MLEMIDWETIWTRGGKETWQKWGAYWRSQGLTEAEIQERIQLIARHPIVKFVDAANQFFWRYKPLRSHGQIKKSKLAAWYGRAWLYPFPNIRGEDVIGPCFGIELAIPSRCVGIDVSVDGNEGQIVFHVGLGASIYVTLDRFIPYKWFPDADRLTGVAIHHGTIWFKLWHDDNDPDDDRFKWQFFHFNFVDFLLGRPEYSRQAGQKQSVTLSLPEGDYPLEIEIHTATRKRSRWFSKSITRAEIESASGVPIPGKGENSWDQEEDAVYGSTFPADSIEDAIAKFKASIEKTRLKYGGPDWKPEAACNGVNRND